jgi:hypothetical protein
MCFSLQFFFSMFISFSSSSATASPSIPCHLCFHIRWFTSGIKHCVYFTIFTPLAVHIWKHLYLIGEKKFRPNIDINIYHSNSNTTKFKQSSSSVLFVVEMRRLVKFYSKKFKYLRFSLICEG